MSKFRVGVVGPFSGPRSCYGELLVSELKASEYAKYFDFIYKDDQADVSRAALVALELVDSNVQGVIGHFNSQSAEAGINIYPSHIPIILPASTAPHLSKYPNVYRMCATDLQQAQLIDKILAEFVYRECYVWTDQSAYAESIYRQLSDCNISFLNLDKKLYDQDLVIFLGAHYNIVNAFKELKYHGKITAICCDDCSILEFKLLTDWLPNVKKYVIHPTPSFVECIANAAQTLYELLSDKYQVGLKSRENQAAKFVLLQL